MVDKIKTPPALTPPASPSSESVIEHAVKTSHPPEPISDIHQKLAVGLLNYRSSPLLSGAFKIFSDGVVFPPHLLNPQDPRNDPKYLRLIAAVLGLTDLERYFYSPEENEGDKRGKVRRDQDHKKDQEEGQKDSSEEEPTKEEE